MEKVVPWSALEALIGPHYPKAGGGRRPYPLSSMLRTHLMQNWFGFSDPAMEEALYEITPLRHFARFRMSAISDENTLLNFRHLLDRHDLAPRILEAINADLTRKGLLLRQGTMVDARTIAAPSSRLNADSARDAEMHQTKKGNQWYFGMKAHIGVDVESGLVHNVMTTAANAADVAQTECLLHGSEVTVYTDAGYTGAEHRVARRGISWHVAAKRR